MEENTSLIQVIHFSDEVEVFTTTILLLISDYSDFSCAPAL